MTHRTYWPEMYDDLWEVYGLVADEVARLLPHAIRLLSVRDDSDVA